MRCHIAGKDLTKDIDMAPHGEDLVFKFPVLGGWYEQTGMCGCHSRANGNPVLSIIKVKKSCKKHN